MLISSLGFHGDSNNRVQNTLIKSDQSNLRLKAAPATDVFTKTTVSFSATETKTDLLDSLIAFLGRNRNKSNNNRNSHKKSHNSRNSNKPHKNGRKKSHKNHSNKTHKNGHKNDYTHHDNHDKDCTNQTPDRYDKTLKKHNRTNGGRNGHKKTKTNDLPYVRPSYEYNNMFETRLVANTKSTLKASLLAEGVHDIKKALVRVSSLSRYLKEDMVGFITPDGDHWFEKAMPYILKGCEARDIAEDEYFETALHFWNLMACADDYWKSNDFIAYLDKMEPNPAVLATKEAVKTMQSFNSKQVAFTGYPSKIKYIDDIKQCAYSGKTMSPDNPQLYPSAEHILPHSIGGDDLNIDINYFVVSSEANSDRGHMPLLDFLKGWDAPEYEEAQANLEIA